MTFPSLFGTEHEYGIYLPELARESDSVSYYGTSHKFSGLIVKELGLSDSIYSKKVRRKITLRSLSEKYRIPMSTIKRIYARLQDVKEVLRFIGGSGSMLPNGSRFYVDAGHPEYSTPECRTAKDLLICEKAGELLVDYSRRAVENSSNVKIDIHKDNSDRSGNSYAAHENYLISPNLFDELVNKSLSLKKNSWINFLITRQIWSGAGKAHSDFDSRVYFQLSQRAEFFRTISSYDTMDNRGIINTRDNSYVDDSKFKRLHVIVGDANMCEVAIFLKVGVSALMLKMLEGDFLLKNHTFLTLSVNNPVKTFKDISLDLPMSLRLKTKRGMRPTALDIQKEVLRLLKIFCNTEYSPNNEEVSVMHYFEEVLDKLEREPDLLYGYVDHITKRMVIDSQLKRMGKSWRDSAAVRMDFLYHNIDKSNSLYHKLAQVGDIVLIASENEIKRALKFPPVDSRAWFRGSVIDRFPESFGNWHTVNVAGKEPESYTMFYFPDPFTGTEKDCREMIKRSKTARELLRRWEMHYGK